VIVSADQCFLLFAPPTLNLPFYGNGVFNALECFVENQSHRSSKRRVATEGAGLMLPDAPLEAVSGRSDVIGAIGATEDV
jgi:hypothetical protein